MSIEEHSSEESAPDSLPSRAQSVWPAFVSFLVAVILILVAQIAIGIVIGIWYVPTGGDAQRLTAELPNLLASTPVFVTLTLASQFVLLVTAIAAARVVPVQPRAGLGFIRPTLPAWGYPVLAVGSLIPMIIGIGAAELVSLAVPLDDSLERTFGQVSEVAVVPFILFIAVVPGLIEEAFFRGYIQRRLRTRWPAWAAVTMTAGLFGLMHIEPAYIAFAYVIGIWLGVVASQTGSVWLSALCHASINAAAGIWNLGTRFKYIPESPPVAAVGAVSILALGCFLASVWILSSRPSMRPADGDVARGRDEGEDNSEHLDLG